MRRRSRGSGGEGRSGPPEDGGAPAPVGDPYTIGLILLGRRELSEAQLRTRLARRGFAPGQIDEAIGRLRQDRTLDDQRVARAAARLETIVRLRGRRRTLQKIRALGIADEDARAAVDAVFEDVDEEALLDQALARRLRGASPGALDQAGVRRVVSGLVRQGFPVGAVLARLRRKGAPDVE
ncbi:MAG: regulatory protein RecX [Vicinamibacteria bacterium]